MKILVTGSSGRIGGAIAFSLMNDHRIIGIDINPGPYTTHQLDISDKKNVFRLTKDVDAIIHTAALHAPHVNIYSDEKFWQVNVTGTENLLEACLKYKIPRFVFTSSTSIYGKSLVLPDSAAWVTEELLPKPRDIYDETKLAAEMLCKKASGNSLSCISLRVSRCFPECENLMAIYRLYRGIDLRDVVIGHKLAVTSTLSGYNVFNISNQTPFQQSDVQDLYCKANKMILHYHPWAKGVFKKRGWNLPHMIDRVYVIEKAKELLGFKPYYNFSEFLER